MNIPKEYILQCEKAEEIQTLGFQFHTMEKESFWIDNPPKDERMGDIEVKDKGKKVKRELRAVSYSGIWLPTQSQLQEMTDKKYFQSMVNYLIAMINKISGHSITCSGEPCFRQCYYDKFTSMEQLWLAFVMKEKYNKTWDGSDWVLEKRKEK